MRRTVRGAVSVVLTAATALALVGWGSPAAADGLGRAAPSLQVGGSAWVSVSVATLWRSPDSTRAVDAPALANPARIQQWLSDMTLSQRRALNGHADTQALLGDQVQVVRLRPRWAKVVVPSQPSQLDPRGYPGWVPRRQLTARPPVSSPQQATVVARTAWLRTDQSDPARVFRISFGTRLPVVGEDGRWVRVETPDGVVRRVLRSAAVLHRPGEPALPAVDQQPDEHGHVVRRPALPVVRALGLRARLLRPHLARLPGARHHDPARRAPAVAARYAGRPPRTRGPDVLRDRRSRPPRLDVPRQRPDGPGAAHRSAGPGRRHLTAGRTAASTPGPAATTRPTIRPWRDLWLFRPGDALLWSKGGRRR